MYIYEIAPINHRCGLGAVNLLAMTGLMTSHVLVKPLQGTHWGWPIILGIGVLPSILQLILLPVCPESPRYLLISKGREQAARNSLRQLRNVANVEEDIEEMRSEKQANDESQTSVFKLFRSPTFRRPLLVALVMQLTQQLSGINGVFYYCSYDLFIKILQKYGHTSADYAIFGIGSVLVLMTFVSIPLMVLCGRRTMALCGIGGMFTFSIILILSFLVRSVSIE